MTKKRKPDLILKLDFVKAYDMVNWDYLIETMENRGFGIKRRQ